MAISLQLCRFTTRSDLSLPGLRVFPCRKPLSVRCSAGESPSPSVAVDEDFDAKVFRKNLTRSKNYNRRGFGHKEETLELMNREYTSDIIKTLKDNGNEYTWGNITVKLAESYGFCWGVERAVQIAYEARKQFPQEKIWITNEIIHNPTVNKGFDNWYNPLTIGTATDGDGDSPAEHRTERGFRQGKTLSPGKERSERVVKRQSCREIAMDLGRVRTLVGEKRE